jgi:hypothetical protein
MRSKFFGAAGLLIFILACGLTKEATPAQTGVETVVAATFEALTAAAPATQAPANGTAIAVNNISFVIPSGFGNGVQAETTEAVPPSEDMPWWGIGPAYNKYLIQGYSLSETFHHPAIYVFPVDEYIQMNPDVATLIEKLRGILNTPSQPLPERLPFLPTFNAGQIFYSNEQILAFQNGTGVRYLTQYAQAPYPANNKDLFYTFQGLTSDGTFYVSAILPINAAFLPADGGPDTPLPAGGVPFDWNNFENVPAHFELVKEKLNATDPNAFSPSLSILDTLIQSIHINSK